MESGEVTGRLSRLALYGLLLWPALTSGAHEGWPLAVTQGLAFVALTLWITGMALEGQLVWRRTALDSPLALLIGLAALQIVLGNRALTHWALAPATDQPAGSALPFPFLSVGSVAPVQTWRSLLLLLTYVGTYVLVVNLLTRRGQLVRLVRVLLLAGGLLGFAALIDHLAREPWLLFWRSLPEPGRLAGTFANPDHFGVWLGMLICLGVGYLGSRRGHHEASSPLAVLRSSHLREQALRRYLPAIGITVMAVAVVFTLSRGALVSLLGGLVFMAIVFAAVGRARWGTAVITSLLAVTLGYALWIGIDPLLSRVREGGLVHRWDLALTTAPMLKDFPLLGVGLGAYRYIYFHYQTPALGAGTVYFPYAHVDLLQLVVETGVVGAIVCGFAAWRAARDLVFAHLFARGRCPVGGGEAQWARRNDSFSVSLALGALAAVVTLLLGSLVDFAARIPANGVLAAGALGMATVALHTRFGRDEFLLSETRRRRLGHAALVGATVTLALVAGTALTVDAVRPALAGRRLGTAPRPGLAHVDGALAVTPRDPRLLRLRADLRLDAAQAIVTSGTAGDGRSIDVPGERREEAATLIRAAIGDLTRALTLTPTDPYVHERCAWAYARLARLSTATAEADGRRARVHMRRAVTLAPDNPFLHRARAAITLTPPGARLDEALEAGREAMARDPSLLSGMVDLFVPLPLAPAQWLRLVPAAALDRLELATTLERYALSSQARAIHDAALAGAGPDDVPLARFMLATFLLRGGHFHEAAAVLDALPESAAPNAELSLARAQALVGTGDARALDAYRAAVAAAERAGGNVAVPFPPDTKRRRALVAARLGTETHLDRLRYHRALGRYLIDRELWAQALDEWRQVLTADPRDAQAHAATGRALEALGQNAAALEAYRQAVALDGGASAYRLRLAHRLWASEQFFQAMNEWREVTARDPGNVAARLALARAYVAAGQREDAFREYQYVLLLSPEHPEARRGLRGN
jgi:tetratricopeptide (TPR) repeat protein